MTRAEGPRSRDDPSATTALRIRGPAPRRQAAHGTSNFPPPTRQPGHRQETWCAMRAKMKNMTAAERRQTLEAAGIIDANGNLAEKFKQD